MGGGGGHEKNRTGTIVNQNWRVQSFYFKHGVCRYCYSNLAWSTFVIQSWHTAIAIQSWRVRLLQFNLGVYGYSNSILACTAIAIQSWHTAIVIKTWRVRLF